MIDFDGELRMWYQAKSSQDTEGGRRLGYAVSQDGYNWERPNLGLIEFNGNKNNNIIDLFDGNPCLTSAPVLYDPDDPDPNRRFKMCIEASQFVNSLAVAYSPDGLRWTESPNNPVGPAQETGSVVKHNGCYYVTSQDELGYHGSHFGITRKMVTFASYDFENLDPGFLSQFPPRRRAAAAHGAAPQHGRGSPSGRDVAEPGQCDHRVLRHVARQPDGRAEPDRHGPGPGGFQRCHARYREPIPDFKFIPAAVGAGATRWDGPGAHPCPTAGDGQPGRPEP